MNLKLIIYLRWLLVPILEIQPLPRTEENK
jgi:hypothetical protein